MKGLTHHKWTGHDPKGLYRDWLAEKAKDARVIAEVGVFAGQTTKRMAEATTGRIWVVDHWKGVPGDKIQQAIYRNMRETEKAFLAQLGPWIEDGTVTVLKMGSTKGAKRLATDPGPVFGLIFLDADHSFRGTQRDIRNYLPLVQPGGILAGHDITWPGVKQAVRQEFGNKWKRGPGTLWFHVIGRTES